ncbi:CehA/McbA family metallohydrolase [Streptomyces sp. NBC_00102]|uniref:CehA/McbA family metallohydrolase n=1 Tax=Streptomyces sp. NBC_00102 TaxID=2975652 RepID=UPI0022510218|nr:CehA/McbA family metallohydrolase [Streptomyces sp. NBC_00102]MCX5399045.1 CehA/McbA family metallohydrolase [Streptomyces sp. NBC_00102]
MAGWYRGDCHVHSVYSDGELTPAELATAARAAGLDFVATTDHNTASAHADWAEQAGDGLLVILGEEVTTATGHWLALGIGPGEVVSWEYGVLDGRIGPRLDQVHRTGGICVAAHPHAPYPSGTFAYAYEGFDAVEVWNGLWTSALPWNADNEAALAEWGRGLAADVHRGRWRPAVGNSDAHLAGQLGVPHTVVLAEGLSTPAVLAALRAGRSWIAGSASVDVSFTATAGAETAEVGGCLDTRGREVVVRARVRGVPYGTVSFHTERGAVHHAELSPEGLGEVEWGTTATGSGFVRAEVRDLRGHMAALTNPVVLS